MITCGVVHGLAKVTVAYSISIKLDLDGATNIDSSVSSFIKLAIAGILVVCCTMHALPRPSVRAGSVEHAGKLRLAAAAITDSKHPTKIAI